MKKFFNSTLILSITLLSLIACSHTRNESAQGDNFEALSASADTDSEETSVPSSNTVEEAKPTSDESASINEENWDALFAENENSTPEEVTDGVETLAAAAEAEADSMEAAPTEVAENKVEVPQEAATQVAEVDASTAPAVVAQVEAPQVEGALIAKADDSAQDLASRKRNKKKRSKSKPHPIAEEAPVVVAKNEVAPSPALAAPYEEEDLKVAPLPPSKPISEMEKAEGQALAGLDTQPTTGPRSIFLICTGLLILCTFFIMMWKGRKKGGPTTLE